MNQRELHDRASAIFLELRDLPEASRPEALRAAAAGDHRLLHEVESLLRHDTTEQPTLETPSNASGPPASSSDTPARIGPYRVIRRIGRGGSGYVLLAEQDEPVRRRVAIKIVPHAALDPDFAARFELERKALERTDHPNIARILDAGRTLDGAGGLPYLVMDFVQGVPITQHCADARLNLRQRIELLLQVADAVQHAHQRGVIHRDLKPANILVGDVAGKATPRVLDFGIAKPIPEMWAGGVGGDGTSPVTLGTPLGTPAYMAPEQAGAGASDDRPVSIDTRADIYALGAVMYELACGKPPNDVRGGDPIESLRRLRETPPPAASRVRAQHSAEFEFENVTRSMLTDLDCILGKALEKIPARRYATVAALADDLRRLLRREPIEARAPTFVYRAARFVQRNRVLVSAAALIAAALTVGFVMQAIARRDAERQRGEAMNQTEAQREINRFLTDDLLSAASPEEEGQNITALDLLHRAGTRVDARFATRPLIAASIHHTLGVSYSALGAYDDADRHLSRAVDLRIVAAGANAPDTVRSQIAAASLLARRQRIDEADAALTQVITRARLILGSDDPALFGALNDLGVLRETQDRGAEAVAILQEALAGRRRLLGERDPQVMLTMSNLAMAYERLGEEDKSLQMQIDALKLAEAIEPPPRMTLIGLNNNVGATFQDLNRDAEAEPYLRKAAELAADWLGAEHPDTLTIKSNLAGLESELGDTEGALKLLDEIIAVRMRELGPAAWDTLTARYAYWNAMWRGKRYDEAITGFTQLLPEAETALKPDHWFVAQTRASLALALLNGGKPAEALPHAEKAVAQFTALYGPDHARTKNAASTLATIRQRLAPPAE